MCMSRSISASTLIRDQLDFYTAPASITRQTGVLNTDLTLTLFVNNSLLSWTVEDGSLVADSSISSGKIQFHEISGAPGYYSVRFFPDRIGFWRLVFVHGVLGVEIIKEYDVSPASSSASSGLNASFTKP